MASAVFYYGEGKDRSNSQDPASLFDAHDLLRQYVGKRERRIRQQLLLEVDRIPLAAAATFAIALLFSGQSSTIIATVAGQIVSEGFLNWSISVRGSSSAYNISSIDVKLALPPTYSDTIAKPDPSDGRRSRYGKVRNRPTPCRLPGRTLNRPAVRRVPTDVVDHEQEDHEYQEV